MDLNAKQNVKEENMTETFAAALQQVQGRSQTQEQAQAQMTNPGQIMGLVNDLEKKIKFWKRFAVIAGVVSLVSYFVIFISMNVLAHESEVGWVFMMMGSGLQQMVFSATCAIAVVAVVRVITLSKRLNKHAFGDYATVIVGLLLVFSPFAASGILSFFRISWNEDGSVSVTVKADDPYYIIGSSSSFPACDRTRKTSNELKNANIDDEYYYVDGTKERQDFATRAYMESIAEETMCQVGEFYIKRGRYPTESEIKKFSFESPNDDVKNGIYDIKLEAGAKPNARDFTIMFDRSCNNKTAEEGNVVVLTPSYNKDGRYCVYDQIEDIVEGLGK